MKSCSVFIGRVSGRACSRAFDHYGFTRHVLMAAAIAGCDLFDGAYHVEPVNDLAEHAVTPAGLGLGLEVQEVVVLDVNEELSGGRIRHRGPRHGEGADFVLEAIVRLVLDLGTGGFLLHVFGHAAALDHETPDNAMEDCAVVEAVIHVGEEILDRDGRGFRVELDHDRAVIGGELDLRVCVFGHR